MRAAAVTPVFFAFVLGAAGCNRHPTTSSDLSVGSSDQGATLTLTGAGAPRALAAYYSFYVQPIVTDENQPPTVYLVITAVDPAFDCAHPAAGLDALSFLFADASPGAVSTTVLSRRGPTLGGLVGGDGSATLDAVDDRFAGYDLDGGTVAAGDGSVAGRLHFAGGAVTLDGSFVAPRCAALDFIVPG